jgi:hypothetical protein
MTSRIDSKVLFNAVTTANHDFFLNRAKTVRFSFSRASRFICNFICEYFLKTCATNCGVK